MTNEARLSIGANNPPAEEQLLIDKLRADNSDILMVYEAALNKEAEIPTEVTTDEESGKVSDYLKKLKTAKKMLDGARETEKAPYTAKANVVQSFFKGRMEKCDEIIKRVEVPLAAFLKKKEDEKRRAAEAKARADKEEADRKLREAKEAEERALKAQREAEAEARRIEEEKQKAAKAAEEEAARVKAAAEAEAKRVADEAAAKLKAAQDEIDRLNKEKADREAAAAQKILQDEADKAAEVKAKEEQKAAEARLKEASKEVKAAAKEGNEILKEAAKEVKELERETRVEMAEMDHSLKEVNKEASQALRESGAAFDDAVRHDKLAAKSERAADEKGSLLSRTRGDASLASVTETYVGDVLDRDALDLETLRDHIPFSALEQAVNSFVRAGGRELKGARIYQQTKTAIR